MTLRYRLPVMVVRDTEGRLLGWWPDLTGRTAALWLLLDIDAHDPEEAVRTALFVLHGAEPPRATVAARERVSRWGESILDRHMVVALDRLLARAA